jgi:uncharacterized phage-associated protein
MDPRTEQLIAYIISNHERTSVTSLMKLCYLIDLVSVQKTKEKITGLNYIRYHYGPYTKQIHSYLENLINNKIIKDSIEYTTTGYDFCVYTLNEESSYIFDQLTDDQKKIADEVLGMLSGYGARALTDIAYKTKPMRALNATLGGDENLNAALVLNTP